MSKIHLIMLAARLSLYANCRIANKPTIKLGLIRSSIKWPGADCIVLGALSDAGDPLPRIADRLHGSVSLPGLALASR